MNYIASIGSIGATLTTISSLPQVLKILKRKHTKDLSLLTYVILGLGVCLWIIYGVLLNQEPIYLANIVTLILVLTIIVCKIRYG